MRDVVFSKRPKVTTTGGDVGDFSDTETRKRI